MNSYFQSEGDSRTIIDPVILEDEIWTKIRINPESLPEGDIEIIPGLQYLRLLHEEVSARAAFAVKEEVNNNELSSQPLIHYQIQYKNLHRKLTITFEKEFPHGILSWDEEIRPLAFNSKPEDLMVSRARRTNVLMLDYWNKNSVADSTYRIVFGDH